MARKEIKFHKLTWVHVDKMSEEDARVIKRRFRFHQLDLNDCIEPVQRPKLDTYRPYFFLVVHLPQYDAENKKIIMQQLNVFVGKHYVVTATQEDIPALAKYWNSYVRKSKRHLPYDNLKNNAGYLLYKILDVTFRQATSVIDSFGKKISDIEDRVYADENNAAVRGIARIRRDIFTLKQMLEPQVRIVGQLVSLKESFISSELAVYFDDVQDYLEKLWSSVLIYKDTVDGLHNTNESMISLRTNEVIKMLTVVSVALLPLTLLTGIYGMNVQGLPFAGSPLGIVIIFAILLGIIIGIIVFSKRRNLI
ncbi:magnesium transporter CorA family protein [Patescibacteria group bacterium]